MSDPEAEGCCFCKEWYFPLGKVDVEFLWTPPLKAGPGHFLFPLINPSRWGLTGLLKNKIFFPTREKEIIIVLLIYTERPCRHIVFAGFWTSCTGLKGLQNGEEFYNLGVGKTARAEIIKINKLDYIKVLTCIHKIQCKQAELVKENWGTFYNIHAGKGSLSLINK